jgi:hypothetical protein
MSSWLGDNSSKNTDTTPMCANRVGKLANDQFLAMETI